MLFQLEDDSLQFPWPHLAEPDGLLAIGGDLSPQRLLVAYGLGIFPWFNEPPYLWWSPDPRCVLLPGKVHISRRLARRLRGGRFSVRYDTAFGEVCRACAESERPKQEGTWITDEIQAAYSRLHELGYAHSIEAWREGRLVGGLYGVSLGRAFFGESMFYTEADASKIAFATFAQAFFAHGGELIDCQQETPHVVRWGARPIPRVQFLQKLHAALEEKPGTPSFFDIASSRGKDE